MTNRAAECILLQNIFGPWYLSLSSYWHCHHDINIIIISAKKNTDNYKTALSSEHHLSPTLAWLSVKFLWAFSLRVTFNVHNLNGFYLFKNFSPLGIDSMICFQTQWILSIFSWIFINRFEPSMTVDHKKNYNHKKWHYQIMVILFTVRQKNHESDLEDSLCGLVDVEHIRSWRVELLDIERQREFWSRGSRYI